MRADDIKIKSGAYLCRDIGGEPRMVIDFDRVSPERFAEVLEDYEQRWHLWWDGLSPASQRRMTREANHITKRQGMGGPDV